MDKGDLGLAISIAAHAFEDKKDKGGKPYILHCLHVMNKMKYEEDDELMIVAVLHDLVEDTDWTLDKLRRHGFTNRVICLIDLLTHKSGVAYEDYIFEIKCNSEDAVKIKMQDLRHNSDITRLKGLTDKDFKRIEKYHRAYKLLSQPL